MITSNLYSMSVKELVTRLSVLLVVCAFAVSAKAMTIQPTYMDGGWGYGIVIEALPADDLGDPNLKSGVFGDETVTPSNIVHGIYKDSNDGKLFIRFQNAGGAPSDVYLTDVEKIKLRTADGVTMGKPVLEHLNKFSNLKYIDLELCSFKAEDIAKNSNENPLAGLNSVRSTIETIIFPTINGMIIPENTFNKPENQDPRFPKLKTVIIPDFGEPNISTSAGGSTDTPKYYIANDAFAGSNVERVSLGYGFTDQKGDDQVGTMMFSNCKSLETLVLNNYIPSLPDQAFEYCYNLEYVDLPMYLSHLGSLCFKRSGIRTVTIPDYLNVTGTSAQAFQECYNLADVYVNTDDLKMAMQGLLEQDQTKIKFDDNGDGVLDRNDYVNESDQNSGHKYGGRPNHDAVDDSRTGQVVTVLHYPGTIKSKENYRVPAYLHYHGVDEATGTTWPTQEDLSHIWNGWSSEEYAREKLGNGYYEGAIWNVTPYEWPGFTDAEAPSSYSESNPKSWGSGFKQFRLGAQNIKEQDVFYENRVTEARWYTVCYPMDLTKTQFETAYGIGADLRKFSGAVYDAAKNAVVLQFNDRETEDANEIYLKKNVPYMVHPARLNYREEKIMNRVYDETTGEFLGYEYVKEDIYINGVKYTKDKSVEVLAFYNIESDLFAKKNADGSDDPVAIQNAIDNTEPKLDENMVWHHCDGVTQNMDFTYRGNYQIETKDGGTKGKKIPAGAFYLGMWPGKPNTLGFYKSDGSVSWPQYVAAILPGTKDDNTSGSSTSQGDAGAKLDVSFFGDDVVDVTTEIIDAPQIQINIIKASDKVYNMNGQVVLNSAKDMKSLPKGIYIVNGRKISVK